ncbi:hypothetical protein TNIN_152381 [Trichonephila inaurata madagascariensis]|uniref:Uncharacterized protein n=1 Tax=Trichonephila inaurata madagascariensis TaxID=2747483 RepID=A0A8X6YA68_9ARAC|nr:hypothetical protein TNIN_152381 [Trichonephila inaurata madagascariensis]
MAKEKRYIDILELSMIPGIAAIIQSKSCNKFSFRVGILLCAVTGFVWQTKVLVEEYLRYPTVLHVEERHIKVTRLPGVTFCYANGLQGVTYCPETGCKRLTVKEFKELYPGEKVPTLHDDFLLPVNLSEIYLLPPKKLLKLVNAGMSYGPTIRPYYSYFNSMKLPYAILKTAPFVRSHSNFPPKCYYFNVIEINETLKGIIRNAETLAGIELHLRNIILPDSGRRMDIELGTGQISVHSRNNFNNPFLTGMSVERGKNVILRVKQVLKKSLPYPYETDCRDYAAEIEERSSPGPTNQLHQNLNSCLTGYELTTTTTRLPRPCLHKYILEGEHGNERSDGMLLVSRTLL